MSWANWLAVATAVAALVFALMPIGRTVLLETFLHPTKRSRIIREDGEIHVIREEPTQRQVTNQ